jgi:D-glucosaminate-6-phosphate ammonia-lyase
MTTVDDSTRIYEELGVRPVINAAGAYTVLGGSTLSPTVQAAMEEANRSFVEMRHLLETSGRIIAGLVEAEAAFVTSGGAAALMLSAAACMTGQDMSRIERLPDASGMKNEIVIQAGNRTRYDRCVTIPGSRLVEAGSLTKTTRDDLADALRPQTAAVHYLAYGESPACLPLAETIEIAHSRGIPVIVDAAGQTYPVDQLRKYARMGADLVCYAGKYFNAPHSTGMITGRRELVEAAVMNSFIGFETLGLRSIGRPLKVDRQEIVALVVALREWLAMDHEERFLKYSGRAETLLSALSGIDGVGVFRVSQLEPVLNDLNYPVVREGIRLIIDPVRAGTSAAELCQRLKDGTPSVWTVCADNSVTVSVAFFRDGEEAIVADRIREALLA